MADAPCDLPLAIRIADATRQRRHAVVREQIAIERIERRVVDVGREHALAQIVEHQDAGRAAEDAKGLLVQLRPDLRARLPRQQVDGLARVAERQHKQPRAPIRATARRPDHRALAVIDLAFFTGGGDDDDTRRGRRRATQVAHEAAHARVAGGEAVVVDQVLPDRPRIAATPERLGNELAVRHAGAGTGARDGLRSVDTSVGEMAGFAVASRATGPVASARGRPSATTCCLSGPKTFPMAPLTHRGGRARLTSRRRPQEMAGVGVA